MCQCINETKKRRRSKQNSALIIISIRLRVEKDAEVRRGITGCINDGYKQICKCDVSEERPPLPPPSPSCTHTQANTQTVCLLCCFKCGLTLWQSAPGANLDAGHKLFFLVASRLSHFVFSLRFFGCARHWSSPVSDFSLFPPSLNSPTIIVRQYNLAVTTAAKLHRQGLSCCSHSKASPSCPVVRCHLKIPLSHSVSHSGNQEGWVQRLPVPRNSS